MRGHLAVLPLYPLPPSHCQELRQVVQGWLRLQPGPQSLGTQLLGEAGQMNSAHTPPPSSPCLVRMPSVEPCVTLPENLAAACVCMCLQAGSQ